MGVKHLLQAYHEARATASDVVSSVPPDKLTGWLEAKHGCDRPVVAWDVAVHRLSIEGARDNPQLACAGIVEAWRDFRDLGCVARRRRAHACRTHARRLTLVPVFEGTVGRVAIWTDDAWDTNWMETVYGPTFEAVESI